MKINKLFILICSFALTAQIVKAQPVLWGMAPNGGSNNLGTIMKINGDGTNFSTPHQFGKLLFPGASPYGNLIKASNGRYYGLTSTGGTNGDGVLFSFDSTYAYTALYSFDGVNGATPQGSLLQSANGILYGLTSAGGSGGHGVIFSFNISTSSYNKLYDFNGASGATPVGSLMQEASNHLLYGTASAGGSNNAGVIFSFDPNIPRYIDLHDFDVVDGANPHGDLIQAGNGMLYGTTFNGGAGNGVIFSYDITSSTYAVTQILDQNNGFTPNGNLLSDAGTLYGMTAGGGFGYGVIYKYNPNTGTYTNLHNFDNTDGANMQGPDNTINNQLNNPPYYNDGAGTVIKATDGKLYGMTNKGGANNDGVIFSINTDGTGYTDLYDFNVGVSGIYPLGSLFQASDGNLYGMTSQSDGGSGDNDGTIFSYNISGGGFTWLYDFNYDNNGSDGKYPVGNFIEPTTGKLYAMTALGGNSGLGTIFSYDITGGGYNTEYSLANNYSAGVPLGSLTDVNGLLYGTTCNGDGGSGNNLGSIFSFDMTKGTGDNGFNPLADFNGSGNGANPQGSLYYSASDNLFYGTTAYGDGGSGNNKGVIFSFDPNANKLTSLYDFNGTNGGNTVTAVVEIASGGDLYGTSPAGGTNNTGLVFGFNRNTTSVDTVFNFDSNSGAAHPNGSLLQASDGKLYGLTSFGGINNRGVLFSYDPGSSIYFESYSFDGTNGANPYGNLIQESDSKLYGLTSAGGANNAGVIFSFDPSSLTYKNILGFAGGAAGANPYGSLIAANGDTLFGLTYAGGGANAGVLFSYDISSGTSIVYLDFNGTDGANPEAGLIKAKNGLLYGMTSAGGLNNEGVLFSIDPFSLKYTEWVVFNGFNGANPKCNLLEATDGKLYGLTTGGGTNNKGVMFSFDPSTSIYTVLVNFDGTTNGSVGPYGNGLMQADDYKIYGTTYSGITGYGNIFSYDINTSAFTDEYDWVIANLSTNGIYPAGTLTQLSNGLLCGTTLGGGDDIDHGSGTIFTYNPGSHIITVVHPFNIESSSTENEPYSTQVLARNGLLYGLCLRGGFASGNDYPYGAIYSMDPSNNTVPNPTYAKLHAFDNTNGAYPYGSLMQASDGNLYGMTNQGGANSKGVIFKYDYSGSGTFTNLRSLAPADGTGPMYGNFMEISSADIPAISVNSPAPVCTGGSGAILTATCIDNCTGITYTWAPSTGLNATTGTSVTADPSSTITYTITATNGLGYSTLVATVVTVSVTPDAPVATAGTGATTSQITTNWNAAAGATGYFLDVATSDTFNTFVSGYNNLNVGNVLTQNVTGLLPGTTYYYRVRATNDTCTSSNSDTIAYATGVITGMEQYSADNGFSLFPNPNNGWFIINLSQPNTDGKEVRIEVINMIGQTIITQLTTINNGHLNEVINLPTSAAEGTYFVRVTAGETIYNAKINISK